MTLYIEMERIYRFGKWVDTLREKLRFTLNILNYFKDIIVSPITIDAYLDSPIIEGATEILARNVSFDDIKSVEDNVIAVFERTRSKSWLNLFKLELVMKFGLNLKANEKVEAYIAMHNSPQWRSAYGDIEFDIFKTENYASFADFIVKEKQYELAKSLLRHIGLLDEELRRRKFIRVKKAVIGFSPDSLDNISEALMVYTRSGEGFLSYILKSVKYHSEVLGEKYYAGLYESYKPVKESIIISRLWRHTGFISALYKVAKESEVTIELGSFIISGHTKNSMDTFLKITAQTFLEKIAKEAIKITYSDIIKRMNMVLDKISSQL